MDDMLEEFWEGINQFNRREFYECHDTLEAVWMNAVTAEKNFFQGILQIAVGLHHLRNENWRGSVILLGEGINRLYAYPADYGGIDVEGLIAQASALLKQLQVAGTEQVGAIAHQLYGPNSSATAEDFLHLPVIQRVEL
jgi:predicted metal-dependent hydrolase